MKKMKIKMKKFNFKFKKNSKGSDKVLSVYWFLALIIIAGGIVAMVFSFYHHPYDVREIEANLLTNKISDCLSQNGNLNPNLIDDKGNFSKEFKNNFLSECNLNFDVEETWGKDEQYYVEINFYKEDSKIPIFVIKKGNGNWKKDCSIFKKEKYDKSVRCNNRTFYSLNGENIYSIKILSVVRKTEKNV